LDTDTYKPVRPNGKLWFEGNWKGAMALNAAVGCVLVGIIVDIFLIVFGNRLLVLEMIHMLVVPMNIVNNICLFKNC
jgi:hypothetical protein